MRLTRIFIVSGFVAILGIFIHYCFVFNNAQVPGILSLEFADSVKGKAILSSWHEAVYYILRAGSPVLILRLSFFM